MDLRMLKFFLVLFLIDEVLSANYTSQQRLSCKSWVHEPRKNYPTVSIINLGYEDGNKRYVTKAFYVMTNYKLNWYAAFAWCRSQGYFLASPETLYENQYLINALKQRKLVTGDKKDDYWISLTDFCKNKSFVWMSTGMRVKYSDWGKGEPNNLAYDNQVEHCGQIYTENNVTAWGDYMCHCQQNFICEHTIYGNVNSYPAPP